MSIPTMRTPLGRVRGHGSAKSGTSHFWHQRLTAIANVPLTIAFVAIVMLLFIGSVTYHMKLGMQMIIEDYVHDDRWKFAALIANIFFAIAVGAACAYAMLKLSFGV